MDLAPDFDEFIGSLIAHRAEFLVVGAYALAFHGAPRFTGDIDFFVRPTIENAERVLAAVRAFGSQDIAFTTSASDRFSPRGRGGSQSRVRIAVMAPSGNDRTKLRPLKTLDRVLSKAGVGSRVEAARWVRAGRVQVNGRVVRDPDRWVDMARDRVRLDGKPLRTRERVYLLLYKPTGYLTTYRDPQGRPTVYDLITDVGTFVSPVGRLDLDTSGLLLMTNDTQLAERITNPTSHVPKTYLVKASMRLSDEQLQQLRDGLVLADGPTRPATVTRVRDSDRYTHFEIRITEGRNRQVRRMVEALGAKVLKLVRVRIGRLRIGTLPIGTWRPLTDAEVRSLRGA